MADIVRARRPAPIGKNVLLVNCHFDDSRLSVRQPNKLPHAMAPVFLAGALSSLCSVRLYNEVTSGPLEDEHLLGWPDMLVLTGLTNTLDRMLHLTAYARSRRPRVIVVAGGPAIRALPLLSRRFFDYACQGDVEELRGVVSDAFGRAYAAEEMVPRYDLADWLGRFGHVEASRSCNFRCSFCSVTAEDRPYRAYPLDDLRRQVVAMGPRKHLVFVDNNFYGVDRKTFAARLDLIGALRAEGFFQDWAALVTSDFFAVPGNVSRVRAAGCSVLFSGIESMDTAWLQAVNKKQNVRRSAVDVITGCLGAGVMFAYGLIFDVTTRHIAQFHRELEFVTGTPDISLPGFLTLPIPLLGTPFFRECLSRGAFLPATKLRDMDGSTLVLRPLDPIDQVVAFVRDMLTLRGYRGRMLRHAAGFARRYRSVLSATQIGAALGSALLLTTNALVTRGPWRGLTGRGAGRTHVTTTEVLDPVYTPKLRVASQYERHFRPTMVTDALGRITADLAEAAQEPTGSSVRRATGSGSWTG